MTVTLKGALVRLAARISLIRLLPKMP